MLFTLQCITHVVHMRLSSSSYMRRGAGSIPVQPLAPPPAAVPGIVDSSSNWQHHGQRHSNMSASGHDPIASIFAVQYVSHSMHVFCQPGSIAVGPFTSGPATLNSNDASGSNWQHHGQGPSNMSAGEHDLIIQWLHCIQVWYHFSTILVSLAKYCPSVLNLKRPD
jgi:hypothetical protein